MAHPQLSIVIPAYNESARIENALERVMSCVQEQGWDAEVLVVDDGSKDDTAAIVQRWMISYPRLHLVQNPGNRGKGYSVRNGLLQAAGDVVMFTDADLSAPMEEAERLLAAIADGADVAIGSRWMDKTRQTIHQPLYRRFFGRCFNWVTRTVMGIVSLEMMFVDWLTMTVQSDASPPGIDVEHQKVRSCSVVLPPDVAFKDGAKEALYGKPGMAQTTV